MDLIIACLAPIGNSGLIASVIGSRRDLAEYEPLYRWYEMQSLRGRRYYPPVPGRGNLIVPGQGRRRALLAC